jgi:hypothetical protein
VRYGSDPAFPQNWPCQWRIFAQREVTDFGCRSCRLWSYEFAAAVVVLGWEMRGFFVRFDERSLSRLIRVSI